MQVLASGDDFSQVLCSYTLTESSFPLDKRVDLALRSILQDKIERVIILIVVVQLDDIRMVEFVHYLDFELYLFYEVMLDDLRFVDDLYCVNVLTHFVAHFVDFAEAADTDVVVGK